MPAHRTVLPAAALAAVLLGSTLAGGAANAAVSDPQLRAAFQTAFGVRGDSAEVSDQNAGELTYRPYRLFQLGRTLVLVSKASGEQCHACVGGLAIHYLRRQGGGFRVVGEWPNIVSGSGFGEPPDVALRRHLFDGPTLVLGGGWAGGGCESRWASLVELTPERPVVRASNLPLDQRELNSTYTAWGRWLRGRILPLERGRSFAIAYSGRRNLIVHYRLGPAGAYRILGPDPQIPGC